MTPPRGSSPSEWPPKGHAEPRAASEIQGQRAGPGAGVLAAGPCQREPTARWATYAPVAASSAVNASKPHSVNVGMLGAPASAGATRTRSSRLRIRIARADSDLAAGRKDSETPDGAVSRHIQSPQEERRRSSGSDFVSVAEAMTCCCSRRARIASLSEYEYDVIEIPVMGLDKVASGGVELMKWLVEGLPGNQLPSYSVPLVNVIPMLENWLLRRPQTPTGGRGRFGRRAGYAWRPDESIRSGKPLEVK